MPTEPPADRHFQDLEGGRPSTLFRWFAAVLPLRVWVMALALVFGVAGFFTYRSLRRDLFPDLTLPTLQLMVQSPGRSAAEIELTIAQPIEQAMLGLPGVGRVVSTLQPGIAQVVVAFDSDADPWRSRQVVGEKLATLIGSFPEGTEAPLVTSAAGRLQEIQELVLEGPAIDPMVLRDHAVRSLVPRLQSVPGVARVELLGGAERTLEISLVPERLRLAGASLAQVLEALEGSERDSGAGLLEVHDKMWLVSVATLAAKSEAVRRIPVHTAHGLVQLGDLAEVREAPGFRLGLARFGGFEAVSMWVVKQPGAETLATARRVRGLIPELRRALPEGMTLELFYDQGELVDRALSGVTTALLAGAGFVALVLVLLLGSVRGAAVVLVVLPLSTLGAAIPLALLGHGLNAMTLGGLAIAVGLLVDAGVIMVENLVHRLETRRDEAADPRARRATLAAAAAEVAVPIVTAVAVILAVFVPLLALPGVAGRLYAPLAVAVASAMTISLALSFTIVPVLVDRFLPPGSVLEEPRLVRGVKRLYGPALDWALRHGMAAQLLALAVALPAVWLATRLGTEFLPELDERALMVQTLLPSDTSLAAVDEANLDFESDLAALPGVRSVYRRTGRGGITEDPMPHSLSDILVVLESDADTQALGEDIEEMGERAPFGVEVTTPMGMRIAEGIGGSPADIEVELYAADLDPLREREAAIRAELAEIPGVVSVTPDSGSPLPAWRIVPDEDALRRLDVPRGLIAETARAALQGISLAPRYEGLQRIERVVRFPNDGRLTGSSLVRLPLVVEEGRVIELGQVASVEESSSPGLLRRKNAQRRLGFRIQTAGDLGGVAKRVEARLASLALPAGTTVGLAGQIEEARSTQRRLAVAFAVSLALVFFLLLMALGSVREVTIVLATLPLAFAGGLCALALAGETWNASSIVGVIGLFGVAVQNSLVLITQTKGFLAQGLPLPAAVREASLGRVRPKLMTAGAAILGLTPMLLGLGGSELERPLAVVMVGGLVTSTIFTLLVLPAVYARFGGPRLGPRGGD
jgi:cobalt-zinc-cadmium resistance protein CzcA